MAGRKSRHRLAAEVQYLLPVDTQNGIALREVLDLLEQPDRMNVAVLGVFVRTGTAALRRLARGEFLPPRLVIVGSHRGAEAIEELLQHHLAVADDRNVDEAGRRRDLFRRYVDTR